MFARTFSSRTRRRGIVLVVVLAMLGLLAVIGFTFATFSNQAMLSARNMGQASTFPDANEMMDYALGQLIDDSYNPQSVIRGHSLKRDMYGNDAATNGAFVNQNLYFQAATLITSGALTGTIACQTNIPSANPDFYAYDFSHWVVRMRPFWSANAPGFNLGNEYGSPLSTNSPPTANTFLVGETFEVLTYDRTGPFLIFYLNPPYANPGNATEIKGYPSPTFPPYYNTNTGAGTGVGQSTLFSQTQGQYDPATGALIPEPNGTLATLGVPLNIPFDLDGRYRHAFNGPGVSTLGTDIPAGGLPAVPRSRAEYGNFRYNGNVISGKTYSDIFKGAVNATTFAPVLGNVDLVGMDEDYDAADLENWFMAIQSADGQVVIPSFHRPGILSANPSLYTDNDWSRTIKAGNTALQQYQALRAMSRILRPRSVDGNSPESFPDLLPDTTGKITYDVDNDGDGTSDSVWLDLGYPPKRDNSGKLFKPLFAFMVIGLNGRLPLNTAGNLSARDPQGIPLFDHADHLGNSPSEIDLRYALQNGFDGTAKYSQFDNASPIGPNGPKASNAPTLLPNGPIGSNTIINGIPVSQTQLRNILTGTRPWDTAGSSLYWDNNVVYMGDPTKPYHLPNGVGDAVDNFVYVAPPGQSQPPLRFSPPVAGRWGEEDAVPGIFIPSYTGDVPSALLVPNQAAGTAANGLAQWHYVDFNNPIRAGHSVVINAAALPTLDARDDNFNATDFYPAWNMSATLPIVPESADLYDDSGSILLPVERMRRFGTPVDLTGDGALITYELPRKFKGASRGRPMNLGGDPLGRVDFFEYFRPAGLPLPSYYNAVFDPANGNNLVNQYLVAGGYDSVLGPAQRLNTFSKPAGFQGYNNWTVYKYLNPTIKASYTLPASTPPAQYNYIPYYYSTTAATLQQSDWLNSVLSNNPYRGFGSALIPQATQNMPDIVAYGTPYPNDTLFAAAMPVDQFTTLNTSAPYSTATLITPTPVPLTGAAPPAYPTFTNQVNSKPITPDVNLLTGINVQYNPGSYGLNEADEMNLYAGTRFDSPFGPSDLEWLYRSQDVDGSELNSRLSSLAPVSFTNPADGPRRRRLFALDSWEMNNLVLANDNPSGVFPTNSRYANTVSTAMEYQNAVNQPISNRGRKINLNFPLPVSNSPVEPIRQKWIRETYTMLKNILPPRAVDTPEELAQLSQYVVNIIDYRDPDGAMTKFVNTDVLVIDPNPALTPPTGPTLIANTFTASGNPLVPNATPGGLPIFFDPTITANTVPNPLPMLNGFSTPAHYLIQYGMEYQPVAITETLAMRFTGANSASDPTIPPPSWTPTTPTIGDPYHFTAFYFELLNLLVKDQIAGATETSDLDLGGWDMVIMKDDGSGRPNPYNGQIPEPPTAAPGNIKAVAVNGTGPVATSVAPLYTNPDPSAKKLTNPVPSYTGTAPKTLVVGGVSSGVNPGTSVTGVPTGKGIQADSNLATQLGSMTESTPYWLYLRRPPNPFDARYDYANPNGNRVVVDCFRFVYTTSAGTVNVTSGTVSANPGSYGNEILFSLQRPQPYRGGHAVPPIGAAPPSPPSIPAYGYSEQTQIPGTASGIHAQYFKGGTTVQTSSAVYSSLGTYAITDAWDYFPFNDRDFTSPAELLMVPGCPPGLFTKQFAEHAPPILATTPVVAPYNPSKTSGTGSWVTTATAPPYPVWSFTTTGGTVLKWSPPKFTAAGAPHTNPYLNDEFFYTGSNETNAATAANDPVYQSRPYGLMWNTTNGGMSVTWPQAAVNWPASAPAPPAALPPNTSIPFAAAYPSNLLSGTFSPTNSKTWQFNYVGGPSGAGWHKMLDLFDVPSPALGAIGPVAQGSNYDWLRQDLKPGLLNLNLIIDEEVFLGLMGGSLYGPAFNTLLNPYYDWTMDYTNPNYNILNSFQLTNTQTPRVATMTDDNGAAIGFYNMPNVGIVDTYYHDVPAVNQYNSELPVNIPYGLASGAGAYMTNNAMKASFGDFLKLRHGGSGYAFAYGTGATGQDGTASNGATTPIASERPFRTLSFPDVDYTILRPATLPPSPTTPIVNPATGSATPAVVYVGGAPANTVDFLNGLFLPYVTPANYTTPPGSILGTTPNTVNVAATPLPIPPYTQDPGVKNPYLFTRFDPVQPPPIPPRRLFQIPDFWGNQNQFFTQYYLDKQFTYTWPLASAPAAPPKYWTVLKLPTGFTPANWFPSTTVPPSNASAAFNYDLNNATWNMTGDPAVNNQVPTSSLALVSCDLTSKPITTGPDATAGGNPFYAHDAVLGSTGAAVTNVSGTPWIVAPVTLGSAAAIDGTTIDASGGTPTPPPTGGIGGNFYSDQRDHPYFRTEWLQKVANLTTVRTHQFAVWITVGFFEVTRAGNPALASTSPATAYDRLGLELGRLEGKNLRYRAFFLVDRTRVGGFNPSLLEDFRNAVVHRQIIE